MLLVSFIVMYNKTYFIFDVSSQGGNIVAADRTLDLSDKVIEKLKATN